MNLYLTHPQCGLHDNGLGHPEMSERIVRIEDQLVASGLFDCCDKMESRAATDQELALVHDPQLVTQMEAVVPERGVISIGEDVQLSPHSMAAARHAAGAVLDGIEAVYGKRARRVFCNVRPPGHHAEFREPKGFCLFNNVAIGAAYALQYHPCRRVAIVDFDVHHGNGTEDFLRRAAEPHKLWFGSSFEDKLYPFSAPESDLDNMTKMPLEKFSGSEEFRAAWTQYGLPDLEAFKPDLILVSAGFDGHALDPLANLRLHENDYAWLTRKVVRIADRHAEGRVVSVLEGGYDLDALGMSAREHIKVLFGLDS